MNIIGHGHCSSFRRVRLRALDKAHKLYVLILKPALELSAVTGPKPLVEIRQIYNPLYVSAYPKRRFTYIAM